MADKEKKEIKNEKNTKVKKEKKPKENKLGKKTRELSSELKKVTWPSFKEVVKKTGVVLAVVAVFAYNLFCSFGIRGLTVSVEEPSTGEEVKEEN